MPITRLVAENFRNLVSVDIEPGKRLNLISGLNGSGKTSVLEVIYTLATGRSFRTRKFKNLVAYERTSFQAFTELSLNANQHRLGVLRKTDGTSLFKFDGQLVSSAAELATLLPCQVINSHSFELLEGGPAERRAFIDWLVFHVKPRFRQAWCEYQRCLKHRNAILRSVGQAESELVVWDKTLAALGEEIDAHRQDVISRLLPKAQAYLSSCEFVETGDFSMRYLAGWDQNRSLLGELSAHRERDLLLGYTSVGPHKADIRFLFNKKPLTELFSRGQQKAVVAALFLAQLQVFVDELDQGCILLLDDLPAELDEENLAQVCRWIHELPGLQIFITGIELHLISRVWPAVGDCVQEKLFHVKQGQITEQPCQWSTS